jgi:acyl-CoA reductase-like NAD-dependent aldehyde dehydrogenase
VNTECRRIRHENFIAGEWIGEGEIVPNANPSNVTDVIGEYVFTSSVNAQAALEAAECSFRTWSHSGIQARADILDRIGAEILARKDELGQLISREEGKVLPEGIAEAVRAGNIFKFFAGEVLRCPGEFLSSLRPRVSVEVTREPVGVIAIITPWNFPLAIPAWKIAPALAFGNCVIFKPAELVAGSAWALTEIISRSGIPPGVFNLVMGTGAVVGESLVTSALIDGISFTGSHAVGKNVARHAVSGFKKVQLELGGKNPQLVLDDADMPTAIEVCVQSAFFLLDNGVPRLAV